MCHFHIADPYAQHAKRHHFWLHYAENTLLDWERVLSAQIDYKEEKITPPTQLQIQLSNPIPYYLEQNHLSEYRNLDPK